MGRYRNLTRFEEKTGWPPAWLAVTAAGLPTIAGLLVYGIVSVCCG